MGTVNLALMGQQGREKLCVVKTFRSELLSEPATRLRIERETDIARRLTHGAVAQTFAAGDQQGAPFLVQEFIDGWTLAFLCESWSQDNRWPDVAVVCHIVQEIARALAYVHTFEDVGLVHRDIAPENIMLSRTGEVKVIDFGIARLTNESSVGDLIRRNTYGAPEMTDRVPDSRADLYGLGVILWSLLARRDPHSFLQTRRAPSGTEDETIEAPPRPSNFNPAVPLELDGVVMRALAYLPEDRFQTANDFHAALAPFIPVGLVGEQALKQFLASHPVLARDRVQLTEMVKVAVPLLAADRAATPPPGVADRSPPAPRGSRRLLFPLSVAGLLAVAAAASFLVGRGSFRIAAPLPSQTPAVAAPQSRDFTAKAPGAAAAPPPGPPGRKSARVERPHVSSAYRPEQGWGPGPPPASELDLAQQAADRQEFDTALRLARRAERNGAGVRAYLLEGRLLMLRGDVTGAQRAFARVLKAEPDNAEALEMAARTQPASADSP